MTRNGRIRTIRDEKGVPIAVYSLPGLLVLCRRFWRRLPEIVFMVVIAAVLVALWLYLIERIFQ